MTEEPPGGWELKRDVTQIRSDIKDGFAGVNKRLDDIARDAVGQREYAADKLRWDERLADLARDIADETVARDRAISELQKSMEKTGLWLRWVATGLLVPVVVPLVLFLLNRGG